MHANLLVDLATILVLAVGAQLVAVRLRIPSILLLLIVAMTIWRGFQRFIWRKDLGRQVSWLYLTCGAFILVVMGVHGSLGAWLASEFGVHITADQLLAAGANVQEVLP